MATMKAVVFDEFGDVDVFHEAEVEKPVLTKGSILIKQAAIAMDPYDVKFRAGAFGVPAKENMIGGSTIAGVVEAVAADVTEFKVGERVVAVPHEHGYAEYAVVDATLQVTCQILFHSKMLLHWLWEPNWLPSRC